MKKQYKYYSIFITICFLFIQLTACKTTKVIKTDDPTTIKDTTNDTKVPGKKTVKEEVYNLNPPGTFRLHVAGFRGTLKIWKEDGKYNGTVKFIGWGTGVPQPVKNLNINVNRIYFVRSVTNEEDMKKYGGSKFFKQEFHGVYNNDSSKISGYYKQGGIEYRFAAYRK